MILKHINQRELAQRWCVSERTLERWRIIGWGSHYIKIGGRVIYRLEDIEQHEIENIRLSTREAVGIVGFGGAI